MSIRVTVLACLAAAWAVSAAGAEEAAEAAYDTLPDWARRPTSHELLSVWPAEALKAGLTGDAVIGCMVNVRGVLYDCVVVSENPPGADFGAAALTLAPLLLMKPATKDGRPVESFVRIPINFRAPESFLTPPEAWTGHGSLEGMRDLVTHPGWVEAPTLQEVVAAYPAKARAARTSGQVTLACVIKEDRSLDPCSVVLEEPRGEGFGKAARRLAPRFRAPEKGLDWTPRKDSVVNIVFSFTPDMLDGKYPPSSQYWVEKPSPADLAARLPEAARKAGLKEAQAELVCRVAPQGRLSECVAANETPAGMGLGEAALALAPKYRVSPWSSDGVPIVGVKVRVPVAFAPKPASTEP